MKPTTKDAYKLLHDGAIALAQVERNGICIDTDYLEKAKKKTIRRIKKKEEAIRDSDISKLWRKRYGKKYNLESGDQLGSVLFDKTLDEKLKKGEKINPYSFEYGMGYKCKERTKTGRPKTDIGTLETLNISFVKDYLEIKRLKKALGTYLNGIEKEMINGFINPVFNLHLVQTYRGSSDSPNFQNFPVRRPEIAELIRQCFIPRKPKNHIVEVDYSGIEVHAAAWYHRDPTMLDYLEDKTKDMHRDMAQKCYKLSKQELINPVDKADAKRIKKIRFCGKNLFVFPEFYGDWWYSCAQALWQAIEQDGLCKRNGTSIKEHLRSKGIKRLGKMNIEERHAPEGSYLEHLSSVEDYFWNTQFKIYKQWKDNWFRQYEMDGYITSLTGFTYSGIMKRNEVINYPVQGVAFHCLLWSLIRIQKLLKKYKMKSLIVGQIHDSIVADVPHKELKDYLQLVNQVMTVDIKKHWDFICTPIEIEAEVAPMGKSWYEKADYNIN